METLELRVGVPEAEAREDGVKEGSRLLPVTVCETNAVLDMVSESVGLEDTEGLPDGEALDRGEKEIEGLVVGVRELEIDTVTLRVAVELRVRLREGEPVREEEMVGERDRLFVLVVQGERVGERLYVVVAVLAEEKEGETLALMEPVGERDRVLEVE